MVQFTTEYLRGLWLHHVLRPRLLTIYRQGRLLEADLKNNPDIWEVREKWVPNEDYLYLMGELAEPVDKFKRKSRGVIEFFMIFLLAMVGLTIFFGALADLLFPKPIDYSRTLENLFNFHLPLAMLFVSTTVAPGLSLARAQTLPYVGFLAILLMVWYPIEAIGEHFIAEISHLSWITSLCGLCMWIFLNSEAFAQFFATRQQVGILRIIMKTAIDKLVVRRSKTVHRLTERKNRQERLKKRFTEALNPKW